MDTAEVGRGDRVLCLNPTGSIRPAMGAPVGALGALSRGIAGAEALVLRHRSATVTTINHHDEGDRAVHRANLKVYRRGRGGVQAGLGPGRRPPPSGLRQAAYAARAY